MNLKTKKILVGLGISTGLFTLNGCSNRTFTFKTDTNGDIVAQGTISYEYLKVYYRLIELKKINGENELYIADLTSNYYGNVYDDIMTGKTIFGEAQNTNLELVNEYPISDYLITYDEIKNEYSIEDIERILEKIKQDYEYDTEKTKVKSSE